MICRLCRWLFRRKKKLPPVRPTKKRLFDSPPDHTEGRRVLANLVNTHLEEEDSCRVDLNKEEYLWEDLED